MRRIKWLLLALPALPLVSPAAHAADACAHPGDWLRPIMKTHTQPPYPEISQMTEEQGRTLMEVSIGKDGVPTRAEVVTSSGSLRLDQAAIDYIRANWRWEPPTVDCKPADVTTRVSVVWSLHDWDETPPPGIVLLVPADGDYPADSRTRHEQGAALLVLALSAEGEIKMSQIQVSSGFPALDDKALQLCKAKKWTAAQMDGHAVSTAIYVMVRWNLPDTSQSAPKK